MLQTQCMAIKLNYSTLVVDVLAAGQDRVEAGAQFDQRADAAVHLNPAFIGLDEAVEHLQQRGFAGAVAADEAEALVALEFEGGVRSGRAGVLGSSCLVLGS